MIEFILPTCLTNQLTMVNQTPNSSESMEQSLVALGCNVSHVLGQGSYGKLYAATRITDSRPLAIKTVPNFMERMDPYRPEIPLEVSLLQRLAHIPGVIKIIDHFWAGSTLIIIMERCESCMNLHQFMEEGRLTPELTRSFFSQLVETVIQCHDAGIVHRNIKPENILVNLQTNTIKLIDFGSGFYHREYFTTSRGTSICKPPEIFFNYWYHGEASEVWSLGALLYRMATRSFPYQSENDLRIVNMETNTFPEDVPVMCQNLIRFLLKPIWRQRTQLVDVLFHPYLQVLPPQIPDTETNSGSHLLANLLHQCS